MYEKFLKKQNSKNGFGIFTTVKIPAGLPIIEATGNILTLQELPDLNDPALLQVGPNTFMCGTGQIVPDYINHSCDPNCYFHIVGNRAILYSIYVIPVGGELTFDYSTTCTESMNAWKMDCHCGSSKCRKVISGFQYLPNDLQENYKSKNIVPLYVSTNILQAR